jgi:hypothetical protein
MITVHLMTIWLANPFSMIMFQAGICGVVAEGLDDPEPLDYNSPDKRVPYYRNNCKRHIDQRSNCCSLRKLEYNWIITEKVPDRNLPGTVSTGQPAPGAGSCRLSGMPEIRKKTDGYERSYAKCHVFLLVPRQEKEGGKRNAEKTSMALMELSCRFSKSRSAALET